jgi:broad specificity phosphatase PhoE
MYIYLVRHAETKANAQNLHQLDEDALSDLGVKQADAVARRFMQAYQSAKLPEIYSSPTKRTIDTAQPIATKLNLPIVQSILLREVVRPAEFVGLARNTDSVMKIKQILYENRFNPEFKYSNEESFLDLRTRANQIFNEIVNINTSDKIIVTHAVIMKALLAQFVFGADYTPEQYFAIYDGFAANKNTGVSQIAWDGKKWWVTYWNDYSHLQNLS